jgi:hypothetical protein
VANYFDRGKAKVLKKPAPARGAAATRAAEAKKAAEHEAAKAVEAKKSTDAEFMREAKAKKSTDAELAKAAEAKKVAEADERASKPQTFCMVFQMISKILVQK